MTTETSENVRVLTRLLTTALETHIKPALTKINEARQAASLEALGLADDPERLAASLAAGAVRFYQADEEVTREVLEDGEARRARDVERLELRTQLISLSGGVESVYGRPTVEALRLSGTTPSPPDALITRARKFAVAVTDLETTPEPLVAWNTIDLATAAASITAQADALQRVIDGLANDTRETQQARSLRDVALDRWQDEARFVTALCRSILIRNDQPDLAAQVLPSQRDVDRVAQGELTVEDTEPTAPTPPADS